jgi:hypothetical protein
MSRLAKSAKTIVLYIFKRGIICFSVCPSAEENSKPNSDFQENLSGLL